MHQDSNRPTSPVWQRVLGAVCVSASVFVPALLVPRHVHAQSAEVVTEAAAGAASATCTAMAPCPPEGIRKYLSAMFSGFIQPAFQVALLQGAMNLVDYIGNRLAYESAVWLGSGGAGQTPLLSRETAADAWGSFGMDAAGELLGNLDDSLTAAGMRFSICRPTNPGISLSLGLSINQAYSPRQPRCDLTQVGANWQSFIASVQEDLNPTQVATKALAGMMKPGVNELSFATTFMVSTTSEVEQQKRVDFLQTLMKAGFEDEKDPVTGEVKTPAAEVQNRWMDLVVGQPNREQERRKAIMTDPDWGKAFQSVGWGILSTFTNTLLSTGLSSARDWASAILERQPPGDLSNPVVGPGSDSRQVLADRLSTMTSIQPVSVSNYDFLSEFVVCPAGISMARGLNHCVMDVNFSAAVMRASTGRPLTVQEAIDEGLLNGNRPLISSNDRARNQDPFCYTYGYCYGNLVKMRKARIIPVGWEMAAERNTVDQPATLQEIINNFDNCNAAGLPDDQHKWCRLIDPNWILKAPQTQCRATVNGELLASTTGGMRASVCVDTPSCVAQDENGTCIGFGYCVAEKNVWNFQGDSCPAQFASCLSFTNQRSNAQAAFLLNTVDYTGCTESNAGCRWYSTERTVSGDGTLGDWSAADASRIYLNAQAQTCGSGEAGCSRLYRAASLRLNMVYNPDFETDANNNNVPDGWEGNMAWGASAFAGSRSVRPNAASTVRQNDIQLTPGAMHTFSVYVRAASAGVPSNANVAQLQLTIDGQPPDLRGTVTIGCSPMSGATDTLAVGGSGITDQSFTFQTCVFAVPGGSDVRADIILDHPSLIYDAVQLEIGEFATPFINTGYDRTPQAQEITHIKIAPGYLNCRGLPDDPPSCAQYARSCLAQDVGCARYAPVEGGPSVPATVTSADRCPGECVGYAAYKQEGTKYDLEQFPVAFIPTTAQACQAQFVGCDAFTNLNTVALGGEGVEHYVDLRACSTPQSAGDNDKTYFTWEGSDRTGYQLRTWQLLRTNLTASDYANAPCVAWNMDNSGTEADPVPALRCADTPAIVAEQAIGCSSNADLLSNPDCREFYDENGDIHYRLYSETVTISAQCTPYRKTNSDQANCQGTGGLWIGAGECRYLGLGSESPQCPAAANGCRAYTGGSGRNFRTIAEENFENNASVPPQSDWFGGASVAISSESLATGGHSLRLTTPVGTAANSGFYGELPDELVGGARTYTFEFWAKGSGQVQIAFISADGWSVANLVNPGGPDNDSQNLALTDEWRPYTLGPLDASNLTWFDENVRLRVLGVQAGEFYFDNVALRAAEGILTLVKDSWTTPLSCDQGPGPDGTPGTGAAAPQYYLGCQAYNDQAGATHNIYQFTRLCPEGAVGCQVFYHTQNSQPATAKIHQLRCQTADGQAATSRTDCAPDGGFGTLCTIQAGKSYCLFDYDGGSVPAGPFGDTFTIVEGPETQIVGNDRAVYVVDDGSGTCNEASVGCQEVGLPVFNPDRTAVTSYQSTYLMNRPDDYRREDGTPGILCSDEALFCEAWNTPQDGTYYFKDPGDQLCEFRTDVRLNNTTYSGWFRKGTTPPEPCAANNLIGGQQYGIWRNGDAQYGGWVGACEARYNRCTEFVDPTDTTATTTYGTAYAYVANNRLGQAPASTTDACNGRVSQRGGCVLFNNTNMLDLPYSAAPSYLASAHADVLYGEQANALRDPISCSTATSGQVTDTNGNQVNLCAMRCAYDVGVGRDLQTGIRVEGPNGFELVGACLTSRDCPTLETTTGRRVEGTCVDVRSEYGAQFGGANASYFHQNDTNTVLSVVRDRQCAEWLGCQSSYSVWDERTGKYEPVCEQLRLYRDIHNGTNINPALEISREPLSLEAYASRNISWYGLEYSGYSIPNQSPVPAIQQVNVHPDRWCVHTTQGTVERDGNGLERTCGTTADCGSGYQCDTVTPEYRAAVVAGSCEQGAVGFGGSCFVGVCRDSGNRCAVDNDCAGATDLCLIGFCQEISGQLCTDNNDCAGTNVCDTRRGRCVDTLNPTIRCSTDASCSGNQRCIHQAGVQAGACVNNLCLVDFRDQNADGQLDVFARQQAQEVACRGYPDAFAPFPSQVVSEWDWQSVRSQDVTNLLNVLARPFTYRRGFEQANVCAPKWDPQSGRYVANNDCMCEYTRVEYGNGMTVRHFSPGQVGEDGQEEKDNIRGICTGGSNDGVMCTTNTDCAGGTCSLQTGIQEKIGWEGYCLEYDTSISLYGGNTERPCLTWLPIDSVKGATDLYGKDIQAGFHNGRDNYYCTETDVYVDLGTNIWDTRNSGVSTGNALDVSCLYSDLLPSFSTMPSGFNHAQSDPIQPAVDRWPTANEIKDIGCPNGYFAVITQAGALAPDLRPSATSLGGRHWALCAVLEDYTDGRRDDGNSGPRPDDDDDTAWKAGFAYICVPKFATDAKGEACNPPNNASDAPNITHTGPGTSEIYFVKQDVFQGLRSEYASCFARGLPYWQAAAYLRIGSNVANIAQVTSSARESGAAGTLRNYAAANGSVYLAQHSYLGCSEVVQTSSRSLSSTSPPQNQANMSVYNVAWTQRTADGSTHEIPDLNYGRNMERVIFGQAADPTADPSIDKAPLRVQTGPTNPSHFAASRYDLKGQGGTGECRFAGINQTNAIVCDPMPDYVSKLRICPLIPLLTPIRALEHGPGVQEGNCLVIGGREDEIIQPSPGVYCRLIFKQNYLIGINCSNPSSQLTYTGEIFWETAPNDPHLVNYRSVAITSQGGGPAFPANTEPYERLRTIFHQALRVFRWIGGHAGTHLGQYEPVSSFGQTVMDGSSAGGIDTATPPQVASIGECKPGGGCVEGRQGFISVNGVSEGNVIGGSGYKSINASFFAWADHEQMPLRRVIVDWGDGDVMSQGADHHQQRVYWPTTSQTGSVAADNFYKNRRGLQSDADNTAWCGSGPEFGYSSQACETGYLNFTHDYVCSQAMLENLPTCQLQAGTNSLLNSPCTAGPVPNAVDRCVFQPRVHVVDNWGWCTGTCTTGPDGTPQCFGVECKAEYPKPTPVEDNQRSSNPWVYFAGYVVVEPR